ncbi:MarR family winged helix-turn-helix transcriptional regulator [Aeromicrobium sp. Leaf350]|uniref:MarR family winged helix-turn-helix transcriptional regulator n=1 Tax=Aeromicrobium sp. Leaf350 TaxID=2876565 RepID=UPI001E555329|nr:MarR family transcriptional regulator [Aeromicrobium sp. Leaf350]
MTTDQVLADGDVQLSHDLVARALDQWQSERPDLDVSPQGVIGRVQRLSARLSDEIAAEHAHHGLDDDEYDVLTTLRRTGEPYEMTSGELARLAVVTTVEMDRRIDRLAETGLVTRTGDALVALTLTGRSVADEAFTAHVANEHRLIGPLSPSERADLERLLARWIEALEGPDHVSR